ncbi:MAG: GTPase Era, partial [Clostridia bacterium]|nr:GTPase Era [Clostridia bacterium]
MKHTETNFLSGFAAIVGRPNVGKSTMMNAMVGEKVAIVSNRPQTTRNRIMGVATEKDHQIVFLDTPGLHKPRTKLGEYMVKSVQDAMDGIDVLLVLVDVSDVGAQDRAIVEEMAQRRVKKILVLNKTDIVEEAKLMATIQSFSEAKYDAIVPLSARTGRGMDELRRLIVSYLPQGPKYFPDDMLTDQPERLICAEIIREKA